LSKAAFDNFDSIAPAMKERKLQPSWLQNISIANFMHVEYVSLQKINHTISFDEIYTEAFLSLVVMLASTIYFMVSTENRFVCMEVPSCDSTPTKRKIKPIFEKSNYQNIRKTKEFSFRCDKQREGAREGDHDYAKLLRPECAARASAQQLSEELPKQQRPRRDRELSSRRLTRAT